MASIDMKQGQDMRELDNTAPSMMVVASAGHAMQKVCTDSSGEFKAVEASPSKKAKQMKARR